MIYAADLTCRCGHVHRVRVHLGRAGSISVETRGLDCCQRRAAPDPAAPLAVDPEAATAAVDAADVDAAQRAAVAGVGFDPGPRPATDADLLDALAAGVYPDEGTLPAGACDLAAAVEGFDVIPCATCCDVAVCVPARLADCGAHQAWRRRREPAAAGGRCVGHAGDGEGHRCPFDGAPRDDGQLWCDRCEAQRQAALAAARSAPR